MTPAGTARAEDPLGQVIFLTKLAEAVPAASIHRQAMREKQQQTLTALLDGKGFFSGLSSFQDPIRTSRYFETESYSKGSLYQKIHTEKPFSFLEKG